MLRRASEGAAAPVDTAAIATAVAAEITIPTADENATAVAESTGVALAVQAAAEDAVTAKVSAIQSGLATTAGLASVVASVAVLTATEFEHSGADSEVEVLAAVPGSTIVVWGYEAYQFSGTSQVEWRLSSGDAAEDPGNVDVTRLGRIPVSGSRIFPPGVRGLFAGQPSKALFSKKGDGIDITGTIWWTTTPNP